MLLFTAIVYTYVHVYVHIKSDITCEREHGASDK